jgi:hypothetical protein
VNFFSTRALVNRIECAREEPQRFKTVRDAARATAVRQFDLKKVVLPAR